MSLDLLACREMMLLVADGIISHEKLLTEADKMGDADHGTGMANGFGKLKANIEHAEFDSMEALFMKCGTSIMMSAGGASGVIFGTLFRDGAKALSGSEVLDAPVFAEFLEAGMKGIMKRGGAAPGDKTMLDALYPAVQAAGEHSDKSLEESMKYSYEAAKQGSDNTRDMIAKSGRMRSLGERTRGYTDPGSITMGLILKYMYSYLSGEKA